MNLIQTKIPDILLIEPSINQPDDWFMESFHQETFHRQLSELNLPIPSDFVQDNYVCCHKGILNGLHYQREPYAQGKLIYIIKGSIFYVTVDLRDNSSTFGQWISIELNERNKQAIWIPVGFAHGFVALEDNTHLLCKTTNIYSKEFEENLRWDDPDIGICWPLQNELAIHTKDIYAPFLKKKKTESKPQDLKATALIDLEVIEDERGSLIAMEKGNNLPFKPKRTYCIFNTKSSVRRGFHAHKHLQQVLVCIQGYCSILLDDGHQKKIVQLKGTHTGLFIGAMIWREMFDFSAGCVLMVLANDVYDETDYIRDYHLFLQSVQSKQTSLNETYLLESYHD